MFVCASPGAPEADRLVELGLIEGEPPSATLRAMEAMGVATLISAGSRHEHRLEVCFDGEGRGRSADFGPELPLSFRW